VSEWSEEDKETLELARRVCTANEIEVLELKASGYGRRRMAVALGISEDSVRSRLTNAKRKLTAARRDT
jgi:DNA-binding CsgD family transcriptional regulator